MLLIYIYYYITCYYLLYHYISYIINLIIKYVSNDRYRACNTLQINDDAIENDACRRVDAVESANFESFQNREEGTSILNARNATLLPSSAIDNYPWLVMIDFHSLFYRVCCELVAFTWRGVVARILSSGARTCIPRYRSGIANYTRRTCTGNEDRQDST